MIKKDKTPKYLRVKNNKNLYFDTRTNIYFWIEQVDGKRGHRSTGVKGEVKVEQDQEGKFWAVPVRGLGAAKLSVRELKTRANGRKLGRPTFVEYSDLVLEIQKNKAPKTYLVAVCGDANLRPFFESFCPYLDSFESNYEQLWSKYINYMAEKKPGKKLGHDRRYLIMVLRRAYKQKAISQDFQKGDFPLNEVTEPVGRYMEEWEVRALLETAKALENEKIYRQIKLSVILGLRKSEIMGMPIEEINLKKREIIMDPKRLKIRRPRGVPVPIHDDVFPIFEALIAECQGRFIFPRVYTSRPGQPVNWDEPQTTLTKTFKLLKQKARVRCRFHDLRHTAITNLVAAGVPLPTISKIMGAKMDLVSKIYDHLTKQTKEDLRSLQKGRYDV